MAQTDQTVKILVCCHKADPNIRQDEVHLPVQVGKALHPDLDLGFQCDNTGDNISDRNASYCELTAMYWAWKNLKDADFVGLAHYRRYFDMDCSTEAITGMLATHDIIMLHPHVLPRSIYHELVLLTSYEDVYILLDTLIRLYPEKEEQILHYMKCTNRFSLCNMFVMSRERFDRYCDFLFPTLMQTEERLTPNGYTRLRRVLGYFAEALLGLWVELTGARPVYVPLKSVGTITESRSVLVRKVREMLDTLSFKLGTPLRARPSLIDGEADMVVAGLRQDGITIGQK